MVAIVHDAQQEIELGRVSDRISSALMGFARARVGKTFRADDLRKFVALSCGAAAPGSADRILRLLRARGLIEYRCLSRSESLYVVDKVQT